MEYMCVCIYSYAVSKSGISLLVTIDVAVSFFILLINLLFETKTFNILLDVGEQ
jgi:hypothetical protein